MSVDPCLPVQRLMGWPLGTRSTVYPGKKGSSFVWRRGRGFTAGTGGGLPSPGVSSPSTACLWGGLSLPSRVRDLWRRRVESFF